MITNIDKVIEDFKDFYRDISIVIVRCLLTYIDKIEILDKLTKTFYKDLRLLRLRLSISSRLSNSLILKL